jgi:hypothetical protein
MGLRLNWKVISTVAFSLFCLDSIGQVPISPFFFSENFWFKGSIPPLLNSDVKPSGVKMIRVGGNFWRDPYDGKDYRDANNNIDENLLIADWKADIAHIKAYGFEPILQIPVGIFGYSHGNYSATLAQNILLSMNYIPYTGSYVALQGHPLYVRYWTIGNEWNDPGTNWSQIDAFTRIRNFSLALREKNYHPINSAFRNNNPLYIIGPDLTYYDHSWVTALTNSPTNLLSTIQPINEPNMPITPIVDFFAVHYYALGDVGKFSKKDQQGQPVKNDFIKPTRLNAINVATKDNRTNNAGNQSGNSLSTSISTFVAMFPNVKFAITEANISFGNETGRITGLGSTPPTVSSNYEHEWVQVTAGTPPNPDKTNDGFDGVGANSFIAGQFVSELTSVLMRNKVQLMNIWSIKEGFSDTPTNYSDLSKDEKCRPWRTDIGYLKSQNVSTSSADYKKSTFHHFSALANYMKGNYYDNNGISENGNSSPDNFKVFASRDCDHVVVVALNQNVNASSGAGVPQDVRINLNGYMSTGSAFYKAAVPIFPLGGPIINLDLTTTGTSAFSDKLKPEETVVWVMDGCGNIERIFRFYYNSTTPSTAPTYIDQTNPNFVATSNCRCTRSTSSRPKITVISEPGGPTYLDRCAYPENTGENHYNDYTVSESMEFSGYIWITGDLVVPSGKKLIIDSALVMLGDSARILVQSGGTLTVNYSWLTGCLDAPTKWGGIEVAGDNTNSQLEITNSTIENTYNGLLIRKSPDARISNSEFMNGGIAITLDSCKGFEISGNTIQTFEKGIRTMNCVSQVSKIDGNFIGEVQECIYSTGDNHIQLDITCNRLEYSNFGIYFSDSQLKDQGTTEEGAGNIFMSDSESENHQLRYDGNSMTYYCDPSWAFDLNVTVEFTAVADTAAEDKNCSLNSERRSRNKNVVYSFESTIDQIVPNPTEGSTNISFHFQDSVNSGRISITNIYGSEVISSAITRDQPTLKLNTAPLAPGVYFCTLYTQGERMNTLRLVVTK